MKPRIVALLLALSACAAPAEAVPQTPAQTASPEASSEITLDNLPDYSGDPYVTLCGGEPEFSDDELTTDAFETAASHFSVQSDTDDA